MPNFLLCLLGCLVLILPAAGKDVCNFDSSNGHIGINNAVPVKTDSTWKLYSEETITYYYHRLNERGDTSDVRSVCAYRTFKENLIVAPGIDSADAAKAIDSLPKPITVSEEKKATHEGFWRLTKKVWLIAHEIVFQTEGVITSMIVPVEPEKKSLLNASTDFKILIPALAILLLSILCGLAWGTKLHIPVILYLSTSTSIVICSIVLAVAYTLILSCHPVLEKILFFNTLFLLIAGSATLILGLFYSFYPKTGMASKKGGTTLFVSLILTSAAFIGLVAESWLASWVYLGMSAIICLLIVFLPRLIGIIANRFKRQKNKGVHLGKV